MSTASTSADTLPLGKYFASTDKKTRDKAIKNLTIFLSNPTRDALDKPGMTKLWKGIFYCFWMSDKPLVQQALASELAEILLKISTTTSSLAFLRGFWEATVRDWNSIDRLRIDKYYMLIRRFVNASFRLLMRTEWDQAACDEYNSILTGRSGPLCPDDARVPASLSYHLADIYVEELDKALGNSTDEPKLPVPLSFLLAPFFTLAARTPTKSTYQRIHSALLDPLFGALTSARDDDELPRPKRPRLSMPTYPNLIANACTIDPKMEGAIGRLELKKALLKHMFDIASEQDTRDSNRRKLYAIWKNNIDDDAGKGSTVDASAVDPI
ncbi:Nop52-domain-containing protein [Sparassis latifolia]|uniref:Ribosomal RNA-processing protein 1 homolog n=1 Tax=Sparassis crispa TaxID=139825 RepID=A0A401G635_9APHY|nr:Ribosomal RNA-processing protein 1 homolog [Sparassis crispa]GBE77618.1 Ribosomal RNA-processing protein 1 homolog [Sparassis crispa]